MKSVVTLITLITFAAGPAFAGGGSIVIKPPVQPSITGQQKTSPNGGQCCLLPLPPPVSTLPKPKPN